MNEDFFHTVEKRRRVSADRLLQSRKKSRLSQNEVAKIIDVDRSTLSKWENNKRVPSVDDFFALSRLYDKPMARLLALDIVIGSNINLSPESQEVSSEISEAEQQVIELSKNELPQGANLEVLRSSVKLIQSFLESFENSDD